MPQPLPGHDWRGLPVTRATDATRAAIDDFAQGLLGYEPRVLNVLPAADQDPDCPLAQACAAMLHLFSERRCGPDAARPYLDRAEAASAGATERERMVIAATRAWANNDLGGAIAIGEQAAREFPRDLAFAKVTQYHLFNIGDFPGLLRVALHVLPANRDVAAAHGLAAFGWEECHRLAEAEHAARTGLDLEPAEPWSQHALAHVLLTQGRNDTARAFLESAKHGWARLNSFMHTHAWWHLALVQIEQGEAAAVLDYYDTHIWGVRKDYSQDQIGAVSLLARLELAGVDIGNRWQDVADYLVARVDDHVQPFLSLHYLYGLARAGRPEADEMIDRMRATAAAAPPIARQAWQEVCLPAADALLAYARGDMAAVVASMTPVSGRLLEIGGSHAQRDLFAQILLDAQMREGHLVAAQQALELRRAGNPHSVPALQRLAKVYQSLDLAVAA